MRSVLLAVSVALACGCDAPAVRTEASGGPEAPDMREIQLAIALAARPYGSADEAVLFLNVNRQGRIPLAPAEIRPGGPRMLEAPPEMLAYFLQRAADTHTAPGSPAEDRPRAVVLLRVDAQTRFEHLQSIMTVARQAGYTRFRLRVLQPEIPTEADFELGWPTTEVPPPRRYTVCVAADDAGKTANLAFHGGTPGARRDHGMDLVALLDAMKAACATERDHRGTLLVIEADPRLEHAHLIQVIDAGTRAGFRAVSLSPLEAKAP